MAEKLDPKKELVAFEELLRAIVYEQKALRRILVRKGLYRTRKCLTRSRRCGGSFLRTSRQYGRRLKGNGGGKCRTTL